MVAIKSLLGMPLWLKKFLAMVTRKTTGDEVWASMLETIHLKSPAEERVLVVSRDEYREKWHQAWEDERFDFLLTVPHSLPAIPAGTAEKVTLISAAYTMIFNIVSFIFNIAFSSWAQWRTVGLYCRCSPSIFCRPPIGRATERFYEEFRLQEHGVDF